MSQTSPDKIKTTFIFPKDLNNKLKAIAHMKNVTKTAILIFLAEKYIRDECQKLNIDPNELTYENVTNPPKLVYNEEDPWF